MNRCIFIFMLFLCGTVLAQDPQNILESPARGVRLQAIVEGTDTFPYVNLGNVDVVTDFVFKDQKLREQWTRTRAYVKKVYPYAILASAKLQEFDRRLATITNEKERDRYIKTCEKVLRTEFEDELKGLSVTQGRILMKLIYRETGKTTYDIVKQMRGGFEASMWQAVARLFGNNMKTTYDARVEDIMIEKAVRLVETGRF